MFFQESDVESYSFHENGLSAVKPIHSMFYDMTGGSPHGLGSLGGSLGIPVGLIVEESSSQQCIRSPKTGNTLVCKTENYIGNHVMDYLFKNATHIVVAERSKKSETRKRKHVKKLIEKN